MIKYNAKSAKSQGKIAKNLHFPAKNYPFFKQTLFYAELLCFSRFYSLFLFCIKIPAKVSLGRVFFKVYQSLFSSSKSFSSYCFCSFSFLFCEFCCFLFLSKEITPLSQVLSVKTRLIFLKVRIILPHFCNTPLKVCHVRCRVFPQHVLP